MLIELQGNVGCEDTSGCQPPCIRQLFTLSKLVTAWQHDGSGQQRTKGDKTNQKGATCDLVTDTTCLVSDPVG